MKILVVLITASLLMACAQQGRYKQRHDSAPKTVKVSSNTPDAVPVHLPYSRGGNKPYTVFGKHYTPLKTGKGYQAQGKASWYGQKFHGHLTSNGEVYNMYAMSAAHKTLPLPSFVKVTNVGNNKSTIVRVNDRGPFHGDRLIDLSYAAAAKLDMLKAGTAMVKLEVIHVEPNGKKFVGNQTGSSDNASTTPLYLQVLALSDKAKVVSTAMALKNLYQVPVSYPFKQGIYKIQLGPIQNESKANQLLAKLKAHGYRQAFKIYKK